MRRIFKAYRELLGIIYSERPFIIILSIAAAILSGVLNPIFVWVNMQVLNLGMDVAAGKMAFSAYTPYLALFVACALLPQAFSMRTYIEPASQLILRTAYKGKMLQKLAIARAAYRNRDFIILDEPTSNLDPLAETEVFKKYIALAEDKTVIFVTHRISVAALADRIVVFKGGKVRQDGTHDELIIQDGEYSRLYSEQAKWYNR